MATQLTTTPLTDSLVAADRLDPIAQAVPFRAGESLLTLQMARGHALRLGHELAGIWEQSPVSETARVLVRTCCGE